MDVNGLTSEIIGAAIAVHRELGPGLFESVYQRCMKIELEHLGHSFVEELPVPVSYRGQVVSEESFRIDLLVEDAVILEFKSVEELKPVHFKQLLTYLRLTGKQVGLLINFNVPLLKDGIHRIVNDLPEGTSREGAENAGSQK